MFPLRTSDPRLHEAMACRTLPQRVGLHRQNLLGSAKGASKPTCVRYAACAPQTVEKRTRKKAQENVDTLTYIKPDCCEQFKCDGDFTKPAAAKNGTAQAK